MPTSGASRTRNMNQRKKTGPAPAGVAHRTEPQLANQSVTYSILGQGTCLGCGPGPWLGACERHPICVSLTCFSPSLSPSLPLSLKINKIFLKKISKSRKQDLGSREQEVQENNGNYSDPGEEESTPMREVFGGGKGGKR